MAPVQMISYFFSFFPSVVRRRFGFITAGDPILANHSSSVVVVETPTTFSITRHAKLNVSHVCSLLNHHDFLLAIKVLNSSQLISSWGCL